MFFYDYGTPDGRELDVTFRKIVDMPLKSSEIMMMYYEEESEYGVEEYERLTMLEDNLDELPLAYIDTRFFSDGLLDWLEDNDIAVATGEYTEIDGVSYPQVRFGDDFLDTIDTVVYR
jgi:hypothetical protein